VLTGASLDSADFHGASLDHAIIAGADLSRARGLDQAQLDEACADGRTRLPPGLAAKGCSARLMVHVSPPLPPAPPIPPPAPGAPRFLAEAER
jgi:hypothetical protein